MANITIRMRRGLGDGIDPHFDARIGRLALQRDSSLPSTASGSGYLEFDGERPLEELRALFATLYGAEPRPGFVQRLAGLMGLQGPSQLVVQVDRLRHLTTDPTCGVALPLHDLNPPEPRPADFDASAALAVALRRLDQAADGQLDRARLIGVTVRFKLDILAQQLAPALEPGLLAGLRSGGVRRVLFGGAHPAWGPAGAVLASLGGAKGKDPRRFGLSGGFSPTLQRAVRNFRGEPLDPSVPPSPGTLLDYAMPERGRGVLVGFVDFGCDFAHPSLRTGPNGAQSRIVELWDQNERPETLAPAPGDAPPRLDFNGERLGFGFGRAFNRAHIEAALAQWQADPAATADTPYALLGYDPDDHHYTAMRPGNTSEPLSAHGMRVMDVAVGGTRAGASATKANDTPLVAGVASEADVVFVQVRLHDRQANRRVLDLNDVIDGVAFIFAVAEREKRPCVVNLSLNTMSGPHDGDGFFERRLHSLLRSGSAGPEALGRAVVIAAGNVVNPDADARFWQHVSGTVPAGGTASFHWYLGASDPTRNSVEIWYDTAGLGVSVTLLSSDGTRFGPVAPGEAAELMDGAQVCGSMIGSRPMPALTDNARVDGPAPPPAGAVRHVVLMELVLPPGSAAQNWTVELAAPFAGGDVAFHAWLQRDDDFPSGIGRTPQPQPVDELDRSCTLGTLACGPDAVVVSAYGTINTEITRWGLSGRGPLRTGTGGPAIGAPGHMLMLARSRHGIAATGRCAEATGTSMAAPFVAGTIACMYEGAGRPLPLAVVREALARSARPVPAEFGANPAAEFGAGLLAPAAAVHEVRAVVPVAPAAAVQLATEAIA